MGYRNKNSRTCYNRINKNNDCATDAANRNAGKVVKRWKNDCHRKRKKSSITTQAGSMQYAFYSVLNTDWRADQGTAAATIASSLMSLHGQLESEESSIPYIDSWMQSGGKIVILDGYDHKHLKYLEDEVKFVAMRTHTVRQSWGRGRIILVLSVFGEREDLEDIFQGLSYLR